MEIEKPTIILKPGDKGTHGGYPVTVKRHYDGNMYEMWFPGGVACVAAEWFIPESESKGGK